MKRGGAGHGVGKRDGKEWITTRDRIPRLQNFIPTGQLQLLDMLWCYSLFPSTHSHVPLLLYR